MKNLKITLSATLLMICFSLQAQQTIERSFTGIERIRLTTASGNGMIKKGASNDVEVNLEYTYDEDDYQPEFEQRGTTLIIKEEFSRSRYTRGYSEWTLSVPDGLDIEFKTGSGNIEVEGLTVEFQASSGSGNIDVRDIVGNTRANTGSGNIELNNIEGEVSANTGSGSIRLSMINGDTDLNTGSGNIRGRELAGALYMNTGSGNIEMEGVTVQGRTSMNTGSGNARLVLNAALDHDVSLSTGSGNAVLDFNGQDIEGQFIMKAQDKNDIRAPFRFDEEFGGDDDDDGRWRRGWRGSYTKEAKVGTKVIVIRISTGSGRSEVRK